MPINYKEYPPDWKETRKRILSRAGDCCEQCGVKNHSYVVRGINKHGAKMITRIVLTIAHLDHDHENHGVTYDRLKALCQKCHLQLDMPRHVENRKYGRNFRKNQQKLF